MLTCAYLRRFLINRSIQPPAKGNNLDDDIYCIRLFIQFDFLKKGRRKKKPFCSRNSIRMHLKIAIVSFYFIAGFLHWLLFHWLVRLWLLFFMRSFFANIFILLRLVLQWLLRIKFFRNGNDFSVKYFCSTFSLVNFLHKSIAGKIRINYLEIFSIKFPTCLFEKLKKDSLNLW